MERLESANSSKLVSSSLQSEKGRGASTETVRRRKEDKALQFTP